MEAFLALITFAGVAAGIRWIVADMNITARRARVRRIMGD